MRRLLPISLVMVAALVFPRVARADPILWATVEFDGEYLRSSTVTNNSTPGFDIVSIIYALGTADVGIATWDSIDGTLPNIPPGGVASDFLSDPEFFQTLTFNTIIKPGESFSEGFAFTHPFNDLDVILSLSPLNVNGGNALNLTSTALRNGSVTLLFSSGDRLTMPFLDQHPALPQTLTFRGTPTTPVPEPGTLLLFGTGVVGLIARRRRNRWR
jgi:hypothetical protein